MIRTCLQPDPVQQAAPTWRPRLRHDTADTQHDACEASRQQLPARERLDAISLGPKGRRELALACRRRPSARSRTAQDQANGGQASNDLRSPTGGPSPDDTDEAYGHRISASQLRPPGPSRWKRVETTSPGRNVRASRTASASYLRLSLRAMLRCRCGHRDRHWQGDAHRVLLAEHGQPD